MPTLPEEFTAESLLLTVRDLVEPGLMRAGDSSSESKPVVLNYPNGRRRDDTGPRRVAMLDELPTPPVPSSED